MKTSTQTNGHEPKRSGAAYPRIPYGESDIRRIRLRGWLYVDKTRFIRLLEEESYVFLIRPRRFGKSLWVSVLENYYDRWMAEHWHAVFDGTDIGESLTEDRSRYVVLRLDFSAFDDRLETLRERFETYCDIRLRGALRVNRDLFPDDAVRRICKPPSIYLEGEKVVQAFLAAHFGMIAEYLIRSEYELNKGYADLYLEPFAALYPEIGYGYVIELKYLKRGDDADEAAVAERLAEATGQLRRYLADDNLGRRLPDVRHVGLALVFHGWDLVACESWATDRRVADSDALTLRPSSFRVG